jgi:hypothetical protein
MTDRPFIGLVLALIVEARYWLRFRWEFDDEACGRAWQLTTIAIALTAGLIWLDGNRYTALPNLLSWMPPLLLPLQFVQSYGLRDSLPLSMFSFLAKSRRLRNQRLGLLEESTRFNFGNVLFATTMVSATVGDKADSWIFLPGLVILTGWILLSSGRSRALSLIPVLAVAGGLAVAGQIGLNKAEQWIGGSYRGNRRSFDPNLNSTLIGTTGTIQQSPDIVWRLNPTGNTKAPLLLRTATFNSFRYTTWLTHPFSAIEFNGLSSRLVGENDFFLHSARSLLRGGPAAPSQRCGRPARLRVGRD